MNSKLKDNYNTMTKITEAMSVYLRKNFPYVLEISSHKDEIYAINRDYEYIGYNTHRLADITDDYKDFERTYIYNDGSKPWRSYKNYKNECIN